MRERTIRDTELDIILESIRSLSLSEEGKEYITPALVTTESDVLQKRYERIDGIKNRLEDCLPLEKFPSLKNVFAFVKESHRDIEGRDIYSCGEFLNSLFLLLEFDNKTDSITPELKETAEDILFSVDYEGEVNLEHPRLKALIRKRDEIKSERYRFSTQYIQANRDIVQNENPVFRNERVVIPVFTKNKKNGEYYISGESQSGNTTFVEPFGLVDLNNRVVLAEEAIRQEKIKILHELSDRVREIIPFLEKMTDYVTDFNFHYVFALWSKRNRCNHIEQGDEVRLINAVHPLLGDKAVPISLNIPKATKVLVLSGANCGGKSVTMKTLALLSLLNQISTFIPASQLSTLPYFDEVYTDIGDGQSIENEESTFSSHMSNIASITRSVTPSSLVILDELGSGTDPAEGAALSLSILKHLSGCSYLTVCTSHYNQVKAYAYTENNMMNASMEFDTKTSLPTYKVLEGIPGDSHALSTAKRAGMPSLIIEEAKNNMSGDSTTTAEIITSLLSKSRTLDRKLSSLDIERRSIISEKKALEEKENELKKALLEAEKEGSRELSLYMKKTRRELEKLVMDVKTGELTKEKTKAVRTFISRMEEKEKEVRDDISLKEEENDEEDRSNTSSFAPGDDVLCGSNKTRGRIVSLPDDRSASVLFENGLRMNVKKKDLVHAKPAVIKADVSHFSSDVKKAKFTLDVRGLTLEKTERVLDDQIEAAILSGLKSFSVIHGYGDGILQTGVREYLKKSKYVESFRFALPEDGGMGKTYVTLS